MTHMERMGLGKCPKCGDETMWNNGEHICVDCGFVKGKINAGSWKKEKRNMIFKHDKAFRQLRNKGEVKTVRTERKDSRPVWISRGYPGKGYKKVCEAYRKKGKEFSFEEGLADFHLKKSGFSTKEEWKEAVKENGDSDEIPEKLYLHKVILSRIQIKELVWVNPFKKDIEKSNPVNDIITPFQGPVANPDDHVFDSHELYVKGDPEYEK